MEKVLNIPARFFKLVIINTDTYKSSQEYLAG
jgi:hypothetical protein